MLAELYLCWKILYDFNQVLAPLCKGLTYCVSFQASLKKPKKYHEHIHFAAFDDILARVKTETQVIGRSEIHTTNLIPQHLIH